MKSKIGEGMLVFCIVVFIHFPTIVYGTQTQEVKTEGMISFTGTYEPIGAPEPKLPVHVVKPPSDGSSSLEKTFPQTNMITNTWWKSIGLSLLIIVVCWWGKALKNIYELKESRNEI